MLIETGRVIKVANRKAMIRIERRSACAKCHAECALKSSDKEAMLAQNDTERKTF